MNLLQLLILGGGTMILAVIGLMSFWVSQTCLRRPTMTLQRIWIQWLSAAYYAGLAIVFAAALAATVEFVLKASH